MIFLPDLLSVANPQQKPFAEYWLGTHDNAPSQLENDKPILLNEFIRQQPQVLGNLVSKQFGRLPYLLKVLDVKDMLSIQVHPSKKAAEVEFEKENRLGILLTAPDRNYKDDNHKPELMAALGDFWLLHGFKRPEEIIESLTAIPEFNYLLPLFEQGGYEHVYRSLLEEEQEKVNVILQPLLDRIIPQYESNSLHKADPDFWAARAALTYNQPGKIDRGIFSIYLLNLVHLKEGEAIFQDAGILHAYLEGQNMEIMANSDNVLRGGLTPKHIDVNELMKHVSFKPIIPEIIRGKKINNHETVFASPAPDFELSRMDLQKNEKAEVHSNTVEISIVMNGSVEIMNTSGSPLILKKGEAAVSFAGVDYSIRALEAAVVYKASVPSES